MPPCQQPSPRPEAGIAGTALSLRSAQPSAQTHSCDMCRVRLKNYDPKKRMRCATCSGQVDCWYTATSWSELLQYNREFIRNKRRSTAYSWTPVFDNAGLASDLLRLHDYGCLVIDARAGGHVVEREQPNATPPGVWYEMKDRAYIRFLLPTVHPRIQASIVGELETNFAASAAIEMVGYYEYAEYEPGDVLLDILPCMGNKVRFVKSTSTQDDEVATETDPQFHKHFFSTVNSNAGRATSKHRTAYREADLPWKRWKRCANNQLPVITEADIPRHSQGKRGFGVELPVSKAVKPVVVTVVCKQWTPQEGLAELLESAMIKLDMQPLFKEEEELQSEEAKGWHKVGSAKVSVEEAIAERISALSV